MIGIRFGKLIVIDKCKERAKNGTLKYLCKCDCGNTSIIRGDHLRSGETLSCGCLVKKYSNTKYVKQGQSTLNERLYRIYDHMKQRCYNKNVKGYEYYGGQGIKVCESWLNDFMTFYDWSINNGYKDNLTIDRINVNGNYEPNNCRWVDAKTQNNNTRRNVYLTYNGKIKTISQWSKDLNIPLNRMYYRHSKGWSDKECLFGRNNGKN